jgi:hypothetical protein
MLLEILGTAGFAGDLCGARYSVLISTAMKTFAYSKLLILITSLAFSFACDSKTEPAKEPAPATNAEPAKAEPAKAEPAKAPAAAEPEEDEEDEEEDDKGGW